MALSIKEYSITKRNLIHIFLAAILFTVTRIFILINCNILLQYLHFEENYSSFYFIKEWFGRSEIFNFYYNPEYHTFFGPNTVGWLYSLWADIFGNGFMQARILAILISGIAMFFLLCAFSNLYKIINTGYSNIIIYSISALFAFVPFQFAYPTYFLAGNIEFFLLFFFINFYLISLIIISSDRLVFKILFVLLLSLISIFLYQGSYFILLFNLIFLCFFSDKKKIKVFIFNNLFKLSSFFIIILLLFIVNYKFIIFNIKSLLVYLSFFDMLNSPLYEIIYFYLQKIIFGWFFYAPLSFIPSQFIYDIYNIQFYFYAFHFLSFVTLIFFLIVFNKETNYKLKKIYAVLFWFAIISAIISFILMPIECVAPLPALINNKFHFLYMDKLRYIFPSLYSIIILIILISFKSGVSLILLKTKINIIFFFLLVISIIIFSLTMQYAVPDYKIKNYNDRVKLFALTSVERNFLKKKKLDIADFLNLKKNIFIKDIRHSTTENIETQIHIHSTIMSGEIKELFHRNKNNINFECSKILDNYNNETKKTLQRYFSIMFISVFANNLLLTDITSIIKQINPVLSDEIILYYYIYHKYFSNYRYLYDIGNNIFFDKHRILFKKYSADIPILKKLILISDNEIHHLKSDFIRNYLLEFNAYLFKMYSVQFKIKNYSYFDMQKKNELRNYILNDSDLVDNFDKNSILLHFNKIFAYMSQ